MTGTDPERETLVDAGGPVRAVLLSGAGRYADPWHPHAATSACLARLLGEAGFVAEVVEDAPAAFEALDGASLLVVNAGDPDGPCADGAAAPPLEPGERAALGVADLQLRAALERGIGLLVMHTGAATLRELPSFGEALGGRWERGTSWHPPRDDAQVRFVGGHPVRPPGSDGFVVDDERYTDLVFSAPTGRTGIAVIAEHDEGGTAHPLVWARELGRSRVVVDLLGHDTASYDSAEHRELLGRAIAWLGGG